MDCKELDRISRNCCKNFKTCCADRYGWQYRKNMAFDEKYKRRWFYISKCSKMCEWETEKTQGVYMEEC